MAPRVLHTLLQLAAVAAMCAGVYLLFGVAWALALGGFCVLLASVVAEATMPAQLVDRRDELDEAR